MKMLKIEEFDIAGLGIITLNYRDALVSTIFRDANRIEEIRRKEDKSNVELQDLKEREEILRGWIKAFQSL